MAGTLRINPVWPPCPADRALLPGRGDRRLAAAGGYLPWYCMAMLAPRQRPGGSAELGIPGLGERVRIGFVPRFLCFWGGGPALGVVGNGLMRGEGRACGKVRVWWVWHQARLGCGSLTDSHQPNTHTYNSTDSSIVNGYVRITEAIASTGVPGARATSGGVQEVGEPG